RVGESGDRQRQSHEEEGRGDHQRDLKACAREPARVLRELLLHRTAASRVGGLRGRDAARERRDPAGLVRAFGSGGARAARLPAGPARRRRGALATRGLRRSGGRRYGGGAALPVVLLGGPLLRAAVPLVRALVRLARL